MGRKRKVAQRRRSEQELMHWAWTVIANAYDGDWSKAPPEWRDGATTWRDAYAAYMEAFPLVPPLQESE